jgi:5'-deoxy-5'-methylthioadenosine phosphorylase
MLAIIGGSGLSCLANLEVQRRHVVPTPYGEPSGPLTFGTIRGHEVIFLARHGEGHTIPPHEVNYRANIWALHSAQAQDIVSIASVGGIRGDLPPGTLALPDQIIDYTHGRECTFFGGTERRVMHIDFTHPYCESLRQRLLQAAAKAEEAVVDGGTYATTQGPRLETAAEINRLEHDGADMVGMTAMPEAALAREQGLCYAALAVVVNHAAGRGSSGQAVRLDDLFAVAQAAMVRVHRILDCVVVLDGN